MFRAYRLPFGLLASEARPMSLKYYQRRSVRPLTSEKRLPYKCPCEVLMQQTISPGPPRSQLRARASSSSIGKYDVFVSHAGEDKHTIAIPLREMLGRKGIIAFVDEKDIPPGGAATTEMTTAMKNADVAVIVLSPEFVAKKWPMKELLFFLHCREKARAKGKSSPLLIPVFYRLSVSDTHNEPDFERKTASGESLYHVTRFFERMHGGEPEADVKIIQEALRTVRNIMGVENKYHASNELSLMPSRQLLLNDTCEIIAQAIEEHKIGNTQNKGAANASDQTEQFRSHFPTESLRNVVLDFKSVNESGEPITQEGRIKRYIVNGDTKSDRVIAILGIGGVGKSTILKALVNDKDLQEIFCDGIHFLSLGKDATVRTLVERLSKVFRDSGATKAASRLEAKNSSDPATTIREAIREALWWFRCKSCLFLIDDVWTKKLGIDLFSHVVNLGCAGPQSTIVFTTREREIASAAPNQESIFLVTPREAFGTESRDILFCHAGIKKADTRDVCSTHAFEEILKICDGLPVSLAAAGKGVKMMGVDMSTRDGDAWTGYAMILRNYRERLLRENVNEYGNLYLTFRASMSLLEGHEAEKLGFETPRGFAEMHRRLFVLQRQEKAPMDMLRHLWELNNESEARIVAMRFAEVGLAECWFVKIKDKFVWHLSIHDSIHYYALSEADRHGDYVRAHKVLLDGYIRCDPELVSSEHGKVMWWLREERLGEDHYLHRWLYHHLEGAQRTEDFVVEARGEDEKIFHRLVDNFWISGGLLEGLPADIELLDGGLSEDSHVDINTINGQDDSGDDPPKEGSR